MKVSPIKQQLTAMWATVYYVYHTPNAKNIGHVYHMIWTTQNDAPYKPILAHHMPPKLGAMVIMVYLHMYITHEPRQTWHYPYPGEGTGTFLHPFTFTLPLTLYSLTLPPPLPLLYVVYLYLYAYSNMWVNLTIYAGNSVNDRPYLRTY